MIASIGFKLFRHSVITKTEARRTISMISEKLKEARRKAGYSQQQLADLADVSKESIYLYEAGKRYPRREQLSKLASALSINISDLTEDKPHVELLDGFGYFNSHFGKAFKEQILRSLSLSPEEKADLERFTKMQELYESLTAEGQERIICYAEDISGNPKYRK